MVYLKIQFIKLKRTMIFPIVFTVTFLIVAIFSLLSYLDIQLQFDKFRVSSLQIYLQIGFPILISILIGLILRIERKNSAFQNTLIYFKNDSMYFLTHYLFFTLVSWIILIFAYCMSGLFFLIFSGNTSFINGDYLVHLLVLMVTTLPIISFIYFLNNIFKNLTIPLIIIFIFSSANFFIGALGNYAGYIYFNAHLFLSLYNQYNLLYIIIISVIYNGIFLILAYILFLRNRIQNVI